jgi:hypothetical protein
MPLFCPYCFEDSGLRKRLEEIRPQFDEGNCSVHPRRKGLPMEAIAAIVDEVFRANFNFGDVDYYDDPDDPGAHGPQRGGYLSEAVYGLTKPIDDDVLNALVKQLVEDDFYLPQDGEEPFYMDDAKYERVDAGEGGHGRAWHSFCHTVTHEQRFLNPKAADLLAEIFKYIHLQRDVSRRYPVYRIGPKEGLRFHRARIVTDAVRNEIQTDPARHLGPPPRRLGKPNRMNPSGVPALYASFDVATCVSELRPLVGAEIVAAEFELTREIAVLDTTHFAAPVKELNLFAKDHIRRISQWRFMQRLMSEIAKPISPDDEHLDYVPTQFVAEYLNKVHEVRIGKDRLHIDAIIYQSAQRPEGKNIVLLGDAAQVKGISVQRAPALPSWALSLGEPDAPANPGVSYVGRSLKSMTVSAADFPVDGLMPLYERPANAKLQAKPSDPFSEEF